MREVRGYAAYLTIAQPRLNSSEMRPIVASHVYEPDNAPHRLALKYPHVRYEQSTMHLTPVPTEFILRNINLILDKGENNESYSQGSEIPCQGID